MGYYTQFIARLFLAWNNTANKGLMKVDCRETALITIPEID